MNRRRTAAAAIAVAAIAFPLLVLGTQSGASAVDEPGVTKSGTGRFSNLAVTVSQTEHLRNQVVRVSWTGGQQSSTSGRNFFNNYLQIMQCWGDEEAPQREKCQYGGIFDDQRGGQATSTRDIVNNGELIDPQETYTAPFPATAVVPFQSVTGKTVTDKRNEFFDSQSTNEIDYGRTAANGTGEEFFEVQTGREASGLGCGLVKDDGSARDCWLVVVPRDDIEVNGVDVDTTPGARLETTPLAASNWANKISFRLDFDPVGVTCSLGAAERRVLGNEEASEAVSRWQPALCDEAGAIFGFSQISDGSARRQTLTDDPWISLVNRPLPPDQNSDGRLLSYAPVSVSAVGIGVVVERYPRDTAPDDVKAKRGTRVLDVKLNARLVAKLLTQSYTASVTGDLKHVSGNPRWLTEDKEFLALNPEFNQLQYIGQLYSITNPLGLSDANRAIWEWIKSDTAARNFIAGKADQYGTKVNPYYKGLGLDDLEQFPRADPSCVTFPAETKQADLCALDHLAYAADFHAAARGAIRGLTLANDTWDISATPPRYKTNSPQPPGERAVLAIVDTATAARFKISMAKLANASGAFVAPTDASMSAALNAMKDGDVKGVLASNPASKVAAAYPLTEVTYAMTAPRQLDADEAKDYANFVRFVSGEGQTPGIAPGQLPEGYLPLPAKLRKQAAATADLIAKRGGPVPPASTDDGTDDGADDGADDGSTSGAETPVTAPPVGGELPGAQPPPVLTPDGEALVPASTKTEPVKTGATRFVLLGAAVLGLLAVSSRPALMVAGQIRRRRSVSPESPR